MGIKVLRVTEAATWMPKASRTRRAKRSIRGSNLKGSAGQSQGRDESSTVSGSVYHLRTGATGKCVSEARKIGSHQPQAILPGTQVSLLSPCPNFALHSGGTCTQQVFPGLVLPRCYCFLFVTNFQKQVLLCCPFSVLALQVPAVKTVPSNCGFQTPKTPSLLPKLYIISSDSQKPPHNSA